MNKKKLFANPIINSFKPGSNSLKEWAHEIYDDMKFTPLTFTKMRKSILNELFGPKRPNGKRRAILKDSCKYAMMFEGIYDSKLAGSLGINKIDIEKLHHRYTSIATYIHNCEDEWKEFIHSQAKREHQEQQNAVSEYKFSKNDLLQRLLSKELPMYEWMQKESKLKGILYELYEKYNNIKDMMHERSEAPLKDKLSKIEKCEEDISIASQELYHFQTTYTYPTIDKRQKAYLRAFKFTWKTLTLDENKRTIHTPNITIGEQLVRSYVKWHNKKYSKQIEKNKRDEINRKRRDKYAKTVKTKKDKKKEENLRIRQLVLPLLMLGRSLRCISKELNISYRKAKEARDQILKLSTS